MPSPVWTLHPLILCSNMVLSSSWLLLANRIKAKLIQKAWKTICSCMLPSWILWDHHENITQPGLLNKYWNKSKGAQCPCWGRPGPDYTWSREGIQPQSGKWPLQTQLTSDPEWIQENHQVTKTHMNTNKHVLLKTKFWESLFLGSVWATNNWYTYKSAEFNAF